MFSRQPAVIEIDTFVPMMTPYELPPTDADLNRSPIIVRDRLEVFHLYIDGDGLPLETTEGPGLPVYLQEPPEDRLTFSLTIYDFGPPSGPEHTYYTMFEMRPGAPRRYLVEAPLWERLQPQHSNASYELMSEAERDFAAAAAARIPAERRGQIAVVYEEMRERQTPDGRLRLTMAEYYEDADTSHQVRQVIGDRLVPIPFEYWSEIDVFTHKKRPEEEAAADSFLDELSRPG